MEDFDTDALYRLLDTFSVSWFQFSISVPLCTCVVTFKGSDMSLYTSLRNYVTLLDNDPRESEQIGDTVDNQVIS